MLDGSVQMVLSLIGKTGLGSPCAGRESAQEQYGRAQMEEGRKKGRKEGLKEGRKEGRKEGKKEGRKEGVMETLIPLIKDGVLTLKEAASRFGISEEALRKRL